MSHLSEEFGKFLVLGCWSRLRCSVGGRQQVCGMQDAEPEPVGRCLALKVQFLVSGARWRLGSPLAQLAVSKAPPPPPAVSTKL